VPESLFSRATRYIRSPSLDPHENRLTEVTAAVLERVDGLAKSSLLALLGSACEDAERSLSGASGSEAAAWEAEGNRRRSVLQAIQDLELPRVRVRTQVTTPKGRFVDLEVWLRPERPADDARDVAVWLEIKEGSDIHGNQLDVYLEDIAGHRAAERAVLLLAPRGQVFSSPPPLAVASVAWQTLSAVVHEATNDRTRPVEQRWLLEQYGEYLREEGLMEPEALDAVQALALMEVNEAEAAAAGICETADAWISKTWGARTNQAMPRGSSTEPDYGLGYWANYDATRPGQAGVETWRGAWFEWGLRNTEELDYVDADDLRGSNVFHAGVTFAPKASPAQVEGNESWLNARLAEGFMATWFGGYHRLVRLKYPDELLAWTTLDEQGEALGRWVVEAFEALASNAPPS
jgi:hypothetical protein